MNKYGFAHIILILLLTAVAIGAVVFVVGKNSGTLLVSQPSVSPGAVVEDEMSGWETYQDNNFTFQYPPNLNLRSSSAENTFYLETPDFKPYTADQYQIEIHTFIGDDLLTSDEFVSQITPNTPDFDRIEKQEKVEINGNEVVMRTFKSNILNGEEAGANTKIYYVYSSTVGVMFKSFGATADHTTLDQILSTFEFTESNEPLDYDIDSQGYQVINSSENTITYGIDGSTYLTVSNTYSVNLESLQSCELPNEEEFCLADGTTWGWKQESDVADIKVDGVSAKSFYVSGKGPDNAYHIIQTSNPYVEFKMYVAGGMLDQQFKDLMDTVKFN